MDYLEFLKQSGKKALESTYIMINREDYLYSNTIERMKKNYLSENLLAFNYVKLEGDVASYDQVYSALVTLPMMSDVKINVIENLDQVIMTEKQLDELITIATDSIGVVNCFTFKQKKSKAYNRLKKEKVNIVEFTKLSDVHFRKWVIKRFKESGKKLDEQALKFFIDFSMYSDRNQQISLYHMENEIKKIVSMEQEMISSDDLRKVMIMPLEMNIFSLTDHLASGNLKSCYEKLDDLIAKGHSEYELMPLLTKSYHNMLLGKILSQKGYSNNVIKDVLGFKSDYPVKMILKRTARMDQRTLMVALEHCLTFESQLKSQSLDKRIHLENLMMKLTR
jgi:DNA polymerase-3 subunit delta